MDVIAPASFKQLIQSSTVLEKDGHGEKVLLTEDGLIVKIFRRKRLLSGALLYPYVRRFANNAKRLCELNVLTVEVLKLERCSQPPRDLVWYRPIEGETFRHHCQQHGMDEIIEKFARFVANLHQKGILFRSLHWGNIIVTDRFELGLIDIADIRFYRRALTIEQRQRNFRHMLRYASDKEMFMACQEKFWSTYQSASLLTSEQCQRLNTSLSDIPS